MITKLSPNHIIRPIEKSDIDQYIEIYLNSYPAGKDLSDDGRKHYKSKHLQSIEDFDDTNYYGFFIDDEMAAAMKLIDFQMNLYGKIVPATGIMALGVHPLYKKQGIAGHMINFFEEYTKKSGALVSLLLPFRVDFYRRLGYGYGTKMSQYHIPTSSLPKIDSSFDISGFSQLKLKLLDKSNLGDIIQCHRNFVEKNHGAIYKFSEEIRDIYGDDDTKYLGCFDELNEIVGYAAFRFVSDSPVNYTINKLVVKELIYDDGLVLKKLLHGLRMQNDLAQTIVISTGEDDFYHLLDNPQDISGNYIDFGFLQTNVQALGTMYKIPDISSFITATSYRNFPSLNSLGISHCISELMLLNEMEDLTIAVSISDENGNIEEKLSIVFSEIEDEKHSIWFVEPFMEDSEVKMTIKRSDISSLLMGSAEFAAMVRLGAIRLSDERFTPILDKLFHLPQKPYANTDY